MIIKKLRNQIFLCHFIIILLKMTSSEMMNPEVFMELHEDEFVKVCAESRFKYLSVGYETSFRTLFGVEFTYVCGTSGVDNSYTLSGPWNPRLFLLTTLIRLLYIRNSILHLETMLVY